MIKSANSTTVAYSCRVKNFGWNGVPRYLVSGWQLAATYQGQSGAPLGFGNVLYYGEVHDIPLPIDQRTVDGWYNMHHGVGCFSSISRLQ